ncbi:tyrosine transaminase [Tieghemostelium lacteum]|uniref:Tyrosine aminotransferase n=1 Tax=Tieghemostelium lacteum TaxID=361077 RepID=A0A151ZS01_TIELA|nr:tyrosine transaminase [Tieghemostelium lacteum]|eukprot:KYQ96801.1 tyrosine transaminase [Tieghemostelium lacteum]
MQESSTNTNYREWNIKPTIAANNTTNPIRAIVDNGKYKPNPSKSLIPLSIGDPCVFGNLNVEQSVNQVLKQNIDSMKYNGYPPSIGYEPARNAVAKFVETPTSPLIASDIILASGASGAIEIALSSLLNPGDNILIPKPGFSLYECQSKNKGFELRFYNLLPNKSWEIDITHLRSLIDNKTKAILINNPSNPCGSVYTREHLLDILAVADEFCLPILADEIYCSMTFGETQFIPIASLTSTVPVLAIGGIAKRFLVPGWRLGWIAIHDRNSILGADFKRSIISLSQIILGPNSLIQSILPTILDVNNEGIQKFFKEVNKTLECHSNLTVELLSKVDGLSPIVSHGAMYQMVGIDTKKFKDIDNDVTFMGKLLEEESVFVLPGTVFGLPNFFRIVFCAPEDKLRDAYKRMEDFCQRHKL